MCGICGFTGSQSLKVLENMTQRIFHRGPDEDGYYCDENVKLGMRRLSIIDLESGKQPVHNEDKSVWTVFNGEVYNFKSLRHELIKKGHIFYTHHSDTEVIVHLYEEYGQDFPNYINGMFALALWDINAKTLILIRDRMGVKPLFYTLVNGNLVFASEIKSILAYPGYKKEIGFEGIYHYFSFKNVPSPLTAFKGIYSLLPGEIIVFKDGAIQNKRYWKINFQEKYDYREEELEENIINALEDAVRIRMISDVPFGAYLSGGVDSSAVVALMSKYHDRPVKTFSLGYEDELANKEADLYYAREVSKLFGTDHYEYIMSSRELLDDIENVVGSFDQPFSGTVSTYFLSKLIKKHVKVALSGDGADELFGSYMAHRLAQPMFHFTRMYDKYQNGSLTEGDLMLLQPFSLNLQYLDGLHAKSGGNFARWRYELLVHSDLEKSSLLSDCFFNNLKVNTSSYDFLEEYFKKGSTMDPLNSILEVDWNSLLPDQVLAFVDFLSMAHSVEVRSPFLDYRLVELVSSIPGSVKIKNGVVKDILKKSITGLIPERVISRPKEGFVLPIFYWMTSQIKGYINEELSERNLNMHMFYRNDEVKEILSRFNAGDNTVATKLWNIFMFQVWYKKYFGGNYE